MHYAGFDAQTSATTARAACRRLASHVPPRARDVAMVFQNYTLDPHLTVEQNPAFGLRQRKTPREEIRRRLTEVARLPGPPRRTL